MNVEWNLVSSVLIAITDACGKQTSSDILNECIKILEFTYLTADNILNFFQMSVIDFKAFTNYFL